MLAIDTQHPASHEPLMADLALTQTARTIVRVEHDASGVTLQWNDGDRSRFHVLWLRDNCACQQCRHPQALERTFMFIDHPTPSITSASVEDGVLEIEFRAGDESHVSRFTKGWLRTHYYFGRATRVRQGAPLLWDARIAHRLPSIDYADYMQTNAGLRAWIETMKSHGIVLLRSVQQEPGKLLDVARRIGPVRASNFGEYYDVVSMTNPNACVYAHGAGAAYGSFQLADTAGHPDPFLPEE